MPKQITPNPTLPPPPKNLSVEADENTEVVEEPSEDAAQQSE